MKLPFNILYSEISGDIKESFFFFFDAHWQSQLQMGLGWVEIEAMGQDVGQKCLRA